MFKITLVLLYLTIVGQLQNVNSEIPVENEKPNTNFGVSMSSKNSPKFSRGGNKVPKEGSRGSLLLFMPTKNEVDQRDETTDELSFLNQQENRFRKIRISLPLKSQDFANVRNAHKRILAPRDIMLPKNENDENPIVEPGPLIRLFNLKNAKAHLRNTPTKKIIRKDDTADEDNRALLGALKENLRSKNFENGVTGQRSNERANDCEKKSYVCYCQEESCRGKSLKKESADDARSTYGKLPLAQRRERVGKKNPQVGVNEDEDRLKTAYDYLAGSGSNVPAQSLPVNPQYAQQDEQYSPDPSGTVGSSLSLPPGFDNLNKFRILPVYRPLDMQLPGSLNDATPNVGSPYNVGTPFGSSDNQQLPERLPSIENIYQMLNGQQLPVGRQPFPALNNGNNLEETLSTDVPQSEVLGQTGGNSFAAITPNYLQETTDRIDPSTPFNFYNVEECMDVCSKKVCVISETSTTRQYDVANLGDDLEGTESATRYYDNDIGNNAYPIADPTTFDRDLEDDAIQRGVQSSSVEKPEIIGISHDDSNSDSSVSMTTTGFKSYMPNAESTYDDNFADSINEPTTILQDSNVGNDNEPGQFTTGNTVEYSDNTNSISSPELLEVLGVRNDDENIDMSSSKPDFNTEQTVLPRYNSNDFTGSNIEETLVPLSTSSGNSVENKVPEYSNVGDIPNKSLSSGESDNQENLSANTSLNPNEDENNLSRSGTQLQSPTSTAETTYPIFPLNQAEMENNENVGMTKIEPYGIITDTPVSATAQTQVVGKSKTYTTQRIQLSGDSSELSSNENISHSLENECGEGEKSPPVSHTNSYFDGDDKLSATRMNTESEETTSNQEIYCIGNNRNVGESKTATLNYWNTDPPFTNHDSFENLSKNNGELPNLYNSPTPFEIVGATMHTENSLVMSGESYSTEPSENTSQVGVIKTAQEYSPQGSTTETISVKTGDVNDSTEIILAKSKSTCTASSGSTSKVFSNEDDDDADYVVGAVPPEDENNSEVEVGMADNISEDESTAQNTDYLETSHNDELPFCDNSLLTNVIKKVLNKYASDKTTEGSELTGSSIESLKNTEHELSADLLGVPNIREILTEPRVENAIIGHVQDTLSEITGAPRSKFTTDWASKVIADAYRNIAHTIAGLQVPRNLGPITVQEHQFKNGQWVTHLATIGPSMSENNGVPNLMEGLRTHIKSLLGHPALSEENRMKPAVKNIIVGTVKHSLKKENGGPADDIDDLMIRNALEDVLRKEFGSDTIGQARDSITSDEDVIVSPIMNDTTDDDLEATENNNMIESPGAIDAMERQLTSDIQEAETNENSYQKAKAGGIIPTKLNPLDQTVSSESPVVGNVFQSIISTEGLPASGKSTDSTFTSDNENIKKDDTSMSKEIVSSASKTLLGEGYDTSTIKYYSPKDRVLEYIKNHLSNDDNSVAQEDENLGNGISTEANIMNVPDKSGENSRESSNSSDSDENGKSIEEFATGTVSKILPVAPQSTAPVGLESSDEDYKFKLTTPNVYEFVGDPANEEEQKLNKYIPVENVQSEPEAEGKIWPPFLKSTVISREMTTEKQKTIKMATKQYGANGGNVSPEDPLLAEQQSEENIYEENTMTENEETIRSPYPDFEDDLTYFGKIWPKGSVNSGNDVSNLFNSSLFYVGDGVRLPLEIRRLNDGSYALSISEKICETIMKRKCPCCVPLDGDVVRTPRGSTDLDSTIAAKNDSPMLIEKPSRSIKEGRKTFVRRSKRSDMTNGNEGETVAMPVIDFARKYNLSLNLEVGNAIEDSENNIENVNTYGIRNVRTRNTSLGNYKKNSMKEEIPNPSIVSNVENEDDAKNVDDDKEDGNYVDDKNPSGRGEQNIVKKIKRKRGPYRYQRTVDDTSKRRMMALRSVIYFLKDLFV